MQEVRDSLFGQLKDPLLAHLTDTEYEAKIFSYLNSLTTDHLPSLSALQAYSNKLQKIKSKQFYCHKV